MRIKFLTRDFVQLLDTSEIKREQTRSKNPARSRNKLGCSALHFLASFIGEGEVREKQRGLEMPVPPPRWHRTNERTNVEI